MQLDEALTQISTIRQQLARTEQFRGYRAAPVAFSGFLAASAGIAQSIWIPDPVENANLFLMLWISVAVISQGICLADVWRRYRKSTGLLHHETTQLALEQFFPSELAGGLLTLVIAISVPQDIWMLPGLWSILFSMGLYASWRLLPRGIFVAACYYLAGGLYAISLGSDNQPLSPWIMPLLFGVGQWITAVVLFVSERTTDEEWS